MTWFMPSYGRPEKLESMRFCPGGLPPHVIVLVNEDDPKKRDYYKYESKQWEIQTIPAESRCSDAHREILKRWPNEASYGLLCDDHWPITPGWYKALEAAAEAKYFSTPNGEPLFPLMRNALCIGGDVARAMGSIAPIATRHNYEDNVWDTIAEDFGLLRPLEGVFVEHRHPVHGLAEKDATYERGSADIELDAATFHEWLNVRGNSEMYGRIAALLGIKISALDPRTVKLAICLPIRGTEVDIAFHTSLWATERLLMQKGIEAVVCCKYGNSHVAKAREALLWEAYREGATHFLFIDSDMGWEPELVVRLLLSGHEFCAAIGVQKKPAGRLCANFLPDPQVLHSHSGFLLARDVGGAFVLLQRSVVDKMKSAYPELRYNAGENEEYAFFLDMIDKEDVGLGPYGERLSEDFSFCRRARKAGIEIWLDPDSALVHAGRHEFTGKPRDVLVETKTEVSLPPSEPLSAEQVK